MPVDFEQAKAQMIAVSRRLHQRNLVLATSGNFSMRLHGGDIAITASGTHKGHLTSDDFLVVDQSGAPKGAQKPSAETQLHCGIYQMDLGAGAILHVHEPNVTVLTLHRPKLETLELSGYEMLKAFDGVKTHEATVRLPIFENTQNIDALKDQVFARMNQAAGPRAYLIRGHGLYAWGEDMRAAERGLEAVEFLTGCELQRARLNPAPPH